MQNLPAPASVRAPPRQATRPPPAAPFRIIPGSAYWAMQAGNRASVKQGQNISPLLTRSASRSIPAS